MTFGPRIGEKAQRLEPTKAPPSFHLPLNKNLARFLEFVAQSLSNYHTSVGHPLNLFVNHSLLSQNLTPCLKQRYCTTPLDCILKFVTSSGRYQRLWSDWENCKLSNGPFTGKVASNREQVYRNAYVPHYPTTLISQAKEKRWKADHTLQQQRRAW